MGNDPNRQGASPRWITRALEASLRRLGTDYIDLYQLHRPDYNTDLDETLGALSDLIRAGKVRAIGSSTFPADLMVEAQWVAESRGHHRSEPSSPVIDPYSDHRGHRAPGRTASRHGRSVLRPAEQRVVVRTGRSARGHRTTTAPQAFDLNIPANRAKLGAVGALDQFTAEAGLPLTHLATAFVRSHPAVTSVIIGPGHLNSLRTSGREPTSFSITSSSSHRQIVPPGSELNPDDNYCILAALRRSPWRRT